MRDREGQMYAEVLFLRKWVGSPAKKRKHHSLDPNHRGLLNRNLNEKENRMLIWDTFLDTYFQDHMKVTPARWRKNTTESLTIKEGVGRAALHGMDHKQQLMLRET